MGCILRVIAAIAVSLLVSGPLHRHEQMALRKTVLPGALPTLVCYSLAKKTNNSKTFKHPLPAPYLIKQCPEGGEHISHAA